MLKVKYVTDIPTWRGDKKVTNPTGFKWAFGATLSRGNGIIKNDRVVRITGKRS